MDQIDEMTERAKKTEKVVRFQEEGLHLLFQKRSSTLTNMLNPSIFLLHRTFGDFFVPSRFGSLDLAGCQYRHAVKMLLKEKLEAS